MRIIVLIKETYINDAVCGWLAQSDHNWQIFVIDNFEQACRIIEVQEIHFIVLFSESSVCQYCLDLGTMTPSLDIRPAIIVLVKDVNYLELANLVVCPVLAILHIDDSKRFFVCGLPFAAGVPIYLSEKLDQLIGFSPSKGDRIHELTKTERLIALMLLQGHSTKSIASFLFRSKQTIEDHRKHIKEKLGIPGGKHSLLSYLTRYTCWLAIDQNNKSLFFFKK